jgi:hypothetical protein
VEVQAVRAVRSEILACSTVTPDEW